MDAFYIVYTGIDTPYIPITSGQTLDVILKNIDTAINTHNTAPNYSGYSLACITQTDGITHPTNTQNFAEGISKIVCDLKTAYTGFTTGTYVSDQGVLTTAINGLQAPAYTYAPFSITSADGINTVWSKTFTGLTAITASIDPYAANWSTLSITPSHSVVTTWNNVITYIDALATTVAGKQASIGTFNNSANCLAGGATDSIQTTIGLLTTKVCSLPAFSTGSVTWGCVSTSSTLQGTVNNIISTLSTVATNYVTTGSGGLTVTNLGSCSGRSLSIDEEWEPLYKVAVDVSDATSATAGYLEDKIESSDSSVTITNTGTTLDLSVPVSANATKVKVNASDSTAGYLESKITTTTSQWGIALDISTKADNSQIIINPSISNPELFIQNMITVISQDPELLAQFCALLTQCSGCSCAAPTGFTVTVAA